MTTCTIDILNSAGASFAVVDTFLDSDGNAFVVGITMLDSDGNSFTVGSCTSVVVTDDTKANAGGGGRKKRLPYYETGYDESRLADEVIAKAKEQAKRSEKPVVQETRTEAKPEQVALVGDLAATIELPPIVVEESAEEDIESAIVLLLLAA